MCVCVVKVDIYLYLCVCVYLDFFRFTLYIDPLPKSPLSFSLSLLDSIVFSVYDPSCFSLSLLLILLVHVIFSQLTLAIDHGLWFFLTE